MILIVGGAGYLGTHIAHLLGSSCVVYDSLLHRDEFLDDVQFVYGDVTDYDHINNCLKTAKTVIWLAAIVGDAACNVNPQQAIAVNVDAVQNLADNFSGKIIFTSTASVYGKHNGMAREDSVLNPQSLYAETKVRAEGILSGKNAMVLRLGTLHGLSPRMRFDLVVNAMTRDAVKKGIVTVFGGSQFRPLIHVKEVAEHIRMWTGSFTPGTYNFASENATVDDIAERVAGSVFSTRVEHKGSEYEDARDYSMDCGKLGTVLYPVHTKFVEESVEEIVGVLRSRRIKDPYSGRYRNG